MNKKRGLGKGLQALIPQTTDENKKALRNINVTEIVPNANQPRKDIDSEKLTELTESIKVHGVIQPIVVRKIADNKYQLVAGERRWRACQQAGLEDIPAIVAEYSDNIAAEVALIENLQREDLNPLEEALAYQSLINEFGITQEELAKRVGKSRSLVANMLRLLTLPKDILKLLSEGVLSTGHVRALIPLKDNYKQIKVAKEIIKQHLSVRQTEKLINKMLEKNTAKKIPPKANTDPEIKAITEQFQSHLGTKVIIKSNKNGKGKIEIEFYNDDDLSRIMDIVLNSQ
ncbi:ParB/RepB/Spo0J family partition protein [Peptococcaceae bacterium 1198_IL3148]